MNTPNQINKQLSGIPGWSRSAKASRINFKKQLWLLPVIAAVVFGVGGWWVQRLVEGEMREKLAGELKTILNADVEALRVWTKDQQAIARSLAQLPVLQRPVSELV